MGFFFPKPYLTSKKIPDPKKIQKNPKIVNFELLIFELDLVKVLGKKNPSGANFWTQNSTDLRRNFHPKMIFDIFCSKMCRYYSARRLVQCQKIPPPKIIMRDFESTLLYGVN